MSFFIFFPSFSYLFQFHSSKSHNFTTINIYMKVLQSEVMYHNGVRKPYGILCDGPYFQGDSIANIPPPNGGWLIPYKPPKYGTLSLFLDLDETLVHYSRNDYNVKHARPGARRFVEALENTKGVELNIFTAALEPHVRDVERLIGVSFSDKNVLCRDACSIYKGVYVKDLSRTGRDPNTSILIDDSPSAALFQPSSLLQVPRYYGPGKPCEIVGSEIGGRKKYCDKCQTRNNYNKESESCKYLEEIVSVLREQKRGFPVDSIEELKRRYRGKVH